MKKQIKFLQLLLILTIASCNKVTSSSLSSSVTTSDSSSELNVASSVTTTSSSTIRTSSSSTSSSYQGERVTYGKYVLKEGITDTSDFMGSPWLNTHKIGVINKIEKPSYKDDFFANANYDYLQDIVIPDNQEREGGVARANDDIANASLDAIYEDPTTGLPQLRERLLAGEKTNANNEINRLYNLSKADALNLFNSDYIFKGFSKLFTLERTEGETPRITFNSRSYLAYKSINLFNAIRSNNKNEMTNSLAYLANKYGSNPFNNSIEVESLVFAASYFSSSNTTTNMYGKHKVSEFEGVFSNGIQFDKALLSAGFSNDDEVNLDPSCARWLVGLGNEIEYDRTVISRLLALNKVYDFRFYLGLRDYDEINRNLYELSDGELSSSNYSFTDEVLEFIEDYYLSDYCDRLYIKRYIPKETKQRVVQMINDIKEEYRNLFQSYTWIDEETKTTLIDKLDAMRYIVFYEDKYVAEEMPLMNPSKENLIQMMSTYDSFIVKSIAKGYKDTRKRGTLDFGPYYTDAVYSPMYNTFTIFHGEGASYLNNENLSDEELYAYMGTVIGHEITHGFDSNGSLYDKDGKKVDTWTTEVRERFNQKVQKLRDRMTNTLVTYTDIPTSGANWDKEVTADMGGLKLAYLAGSKKPNFNLDKFFKAYVHYFAYIATDAYIRKMASNTHPIGYIRSNFVLSQFKEFHDYYDIKEGDMMYTSPNDIVAIW